MTGSLVRCCALALALAAAGCDDLFGPDPERVADGELTIVPFAPNAPPLTALHVSFWAVKGENREVQILYQYPNGSTAKCLRFIVPANALLSDADGNRFAAGDSVQITVDVTDPDYFIFEFAPRGLDFDPRNPARMEINYEYATDDLDGDGVEGDPDDLAIRSRMGLWRQERANGAWEQIASSRNAADNELSANIEGFTRYALAAD